MIWINKIMRFWGNSNHFKIKFILSEQTLKWSAVRGNRFIHSLNSYLETGNTKIQKRDIPAKEFRWIFRVLAGIDRGREYVAINREIRVGRHPENLILLRDPKASRFHAIIYRRGSKLVLEDLKSTNGTRVNGELVLKKRTIIPGDLIKIGETVIQVSLEND
jgi:hypothetical protein